MTYLDRVEACHRFDLSRFLPFLVDGVAYGWVRPAFAERLRRFPGVFEVDDVSVGLHPRLTDYEQRTEAVAAVVAELAKAGVIRGWRDENYPVALEAGEAPVFEIERAAVPHFGFRAWGVHVNGLVRQGDETLVWIAQRAADKETCPGMLDHLAAGGQPVGIDRLDNVVKECGEEAGVPPELARNARFVRELHYCCETASGLKPDTIAVYDLWLPEDFVPRNTDGEVASFFLWTLDELAPIVAGTRRFKPNCNLVLIDLLLRLGRLDPETVEMRAVAERLYAPPPGAGCRSHFARKDQHPDPKTGNS